MIHRNPATCRGETRNISLQQRFRVVVSLMHPLVHRLGGQCRHLLAVREAQAAESGRKVEIGLKTRSQVFVRFLHDVPLYKPNRTRLAPVRQ